MKIFITGCARSGTTILRRMFYAFDDISIYDQDEIDIDPFVSMNYNTGFLVGKRTHKSILSNIIPVEEASRQAAILKKNNICIINCVRDGRDIIEKVTNHHLDPRPSARRWMACIEATKQWGFIINCEIKYEHLVDINKTDLIQQKIAALTGLTIKDKWSNYPKFVPGPDDAINLGKPRYDLKPLHTNVINRDHSVYNNLKPEIKSEFDQYLKYLGYII